MLNEKIREEIRRAFEKTLPGYLLVLNQLSLRKTGKSILDLILESPCMVYKLLRILYDEISVDFVVRKLIIKTITTIMEKPELEEKLLKLMKECNDEEFLKLLLS